MKKGNDPSDLPAVAKEIVLALLDGDWTRYSDDFGTHFYYIIRERDHSIEVENCRAFDKAAGLQEARTRCVRELVHSGRIS